MTYRPEIDGLRAVAVFAVILFHLDPAWLPGGFLGVDIFFVISGYLITCIIHRQLLEGTFSLKGFWIRRVKRLYPALVAMVAAVLVAGGLLLVNPERRELMLQSIAALCSFENILLWKSTGGYWARSSDSIALLHCWSLSLEEQFYVFFPPILLLTHRIARSKLVWVLVALAVGSFLLCLLLTRAQLQSASFYLLPTRMWELLMGSLLAVAPAASLSSRWSRLAPYLGTGLILGSILFVSNGPGFPGAWPFFSCLGAVLILRYATGGYVQKVLSHGAPVFLGKISYSLYLWHWPVIVFSRYLTPNAEALWVLVAAFLCAVASYYLVEVPWRFGTRPPVWLARGLPAVAAASALVFAFLPPGVLLDDLRDLTSEASLTFGEDYEATDALRRGEPGIPFGAEMQGQLDLCLLGSSHARVLGKSFDDFCQANQLSGMSMAASGLCITMNRSSAHVPDACELNDHRFQTVRSLHPRVTIVAGQWNQTFQEPGFEERLVVRLTELAEICDQVIVLGQVPLIELPAKYEFSLRKYLVAQEMSDQERKYLSRPNVVIANAVVERAVSSVHREHLRFVNPYDFFLLEDRTVGVVRDGRVLYYDNNHVNDAGAKFLFDGILREPLTAEFLSSSRSPLAARSNSLVDDAQSGFFAR